jgi:hypothetical protein
MEPDNDQDNRRDGPQPEPSTQPLHRITETHTPTQEGTNPTKTPGNETLPFLSKLARYLNWPSEVVGFLVMIGTVGACVFTGFQLVLTRTTIKTEQRAWLGIAGDATTAPPRRWSIQPNAPIKVSMWIKNIGKTPALNISTTADVLVDDITTHEWPRDFPDRSKALYSGLMMPNAASFAEPPADRILSADEFAAFVAKKSAVYFYGTILYDDWFGDRHTTLWCYRVTHEAHPDTWLVSSCRPHNSAN